MNHEDIARRAASALKVIQLASRPEMDIVAIKLNMGPTHEETAVALRWQLALELATDETLSPIDIARILLEASNVGK